MIIVRSEDGPHRELEVKKGEALMWQLRRSKLGIAGLCNGNAACGTCHVYVEQQWLDRLEPADEYEEEMLEEVRHRRPTSRLSCQIEYSSELDGLELTIAPRN